MEVCVNNVWGTVCDNSWSSTDTSVVCSRLGFSKFGIHSKLIDLRLLLIIKLGKSQGKRFQCMQ